MLSWLGLARVLFAVAERVARYLGDKQLIDAGQAISTANQLRRTNDEIARALAARRAVKHDADSIMRDPDNRDGQ